MKTRSTYVVLVQLEDGLFHVVGTYRSFKRAEGDARAWDGLLGSTSVEPILTPAQYLTLKHRNDSDDSDD